MTAPQGHARVCPTRTDGAGALFTHKVTQAQCQSRQRGQYHKCYTCAFNNAWVAAHGLPSGQPQGSRKKNGVKPAARAKVEAAT